MNTYTSLLREMKEDQSTWVDAVVVIDLAEVKSMTKAQRKALWDKAKKGNSVTLPNVDMDKYPPIKGMEGPFRFRSGIVLYYDNKKGKYYDRRKDMYLDDDEFMAHSQGSKYKPQRLRKEDAVIVLDETSKKQANDMFRTTARTTKSNPDYTGVAIINLGPTKIAVIKDGNKYVARLLNGDVITDNSLAGVTRKIRAAHRIGEETEINEVVKAGQTGLGNEYKNPYVPKDVKRSMSNIGDSLKDFFFACYRYYYEFFLWKKDGGPKHGQLKDQEKYLKAIKQRYKGTDASHTEDLAKSAAKADVAGDHKKSAGFVKKAGIPMREDVGLDEGKIKRVVKAVKKTHNKIDKALQKTEPITHPIETAKVALAKKAEKGNAALARGEDTEYDDIEYLPEVVQVAPKYKHFGKINKIVKNIVVIDKVSDYYIATTSGITGKQEQVAWSKIGEQLMKWLNKNNISRQYMSITPVAKKELDERKLTEPEKEKKEEVVKSIKKKSFDGFKKRYGDDAKSVMYGTATNVAKRKSNEETSVVSSTFVGRFGAFVKNIEESREDQSLTENLVQYFMDKGKPESDAREFVASIRKEELAKIKKVLAERKILDKDKKDAFKALEDINKQFHLSPAAYKKAKKAISDAKTPDQIHTALATVTEEAGDEREVIEETKGKFDIKSIVKSVLEEDQQ